jgi:hypothetical protein
MQYDVSICNSEVIHLNDPLLILELTELLIRSKNLGDKDISGFGWYVYAEGETQAYPFGLLKALKNKGASQSGTLSEEEIAKAKEFDLSVMNLVPYYF